MLTRTQKQLLIGGAYILVAVLIAGGIYWSKYRPTCSDGIKNGKEEAVDCGTLACGKACAAPLQALVVQDVQLVTSAGTHDVVVKVYNPNTEHGISAGLYDIVIRDAGEQEEIGRVRNLSFYMLPGQTKYLVRAAIPGTRQGVKASIEIRNVEWVKVAADPDVNFIITREAYTPGDRQSIYEAVIANRSDFDFDRVDVSVILFDKDGLIGTNTTNVQTFISETERSVKLVWPFELNQADQIYVEIGTNVFNNANFIQRNGTQEKFQQYY